MGYEAATEEFAPARRARRGPAYQAYLILYLAFVVAPIVTGLDKFGSVLVDWQQYLAPRLAALVPMAPSTIMSAVGVVEVAAGLLVAAKPSVGAWVVCAWLWAIIVNLLLVPGYFDIALRDFGLSLGALALARLSPLFEWEQAAR
jgi:hypothetical protein